jgi:hypothetical protein
LILPTPIAKAPNGVKSHPIQPPPILPVVIREPFSWHTRTQSLHSAVGGVRSLQPDSKTSNPPVPNLMKPTTPPPPERIDEKKIVREETNTVVDLLPSVPECSAKKLIVGTTHHHTIDVPMEIAKLKAKRQERMMRLDELKQFQHLQNVNLKLNTLRQEQAIMRLSKQHQLLLLGVSATNSI